VCYYIAELGKVIAVTNQKGGVGKTTTAINLGASLAVSEFRVLLVDSDPQGNATSGVGVTKDPAKPSLYNVLLGDAEIAEALIKTDLEGLHLVPANKNLVGANLELVDLERREFRLRDKIVQVKDTYDFIIIDCPPALDLLTLNALMAADSVLIPIQCEFFALEGISELIATIDRIRETMQHSLQIEGILITMFDDRTNLTRQVATDLREFFGKDVLQTVIPRSVRLAWAGPPTVPSLADCGNPFAPAAFAQDDFLRALCDSRTIRPENRQTLSKEWVRERCNVAAQQSLTITS
jgi:chromosome partitioning protein